MLSGSENYIKQTNIEDTDAMIIMLASKGYDTFTNLSQMDSKELLDIIEFESIKTSIEKHMIEQAKNGNS